MSQTRRQFLGSAALAAGMRAAGKRPPNILFIVLDDLGSGDFGCYGQRYIKTPNADRTAAEGARFTNFYAGGAVCAPSRCTLMTGYHTGHAAVRANAGTIPISADDFTVAQLLKKAGYATGGFGKWGLGDARSTGTPTRHGFDKFFGYLHQVHAHSYYPDFLWDNDTKFPLTGNHDGTGTEYSADLIAERSFQFLRENKDKPFFLYACYTLPHAKFEIPNLAPYENESWTKGQKTYAAMVTRADAYIGRLLAMLKEYKLEQDTVVFITSDNGAHSGESKGYEFFKSNGNLRGEKTQLYEGGIRAPMIVRWPGRVKPGSTNDLAWAFWDFMPTAAEIAGVKAPAGIDGISVLPTITGKPQRGHEFMYWEALAYDQKNKTFRDERMWQAVRMGDWKAVRPQGAAKLELYNLKMDPGEQKDVAAANPQIIKRIEAYLATARTQPRRHDTGSMDWVK